MISAIWPMKATSSITSCVTRPPRLRTTIASLRPRPRTCEVDARIEARDHEQAQVGEDDRSLVTAGGGEGAVALERAIDVGRCHDCAPFRGDGFAGSGARWVGCRHCARA